MKNLAVISFIFLLLSACQQNMVANEKTADSVIGKWRVYETVEFQNNDDSASVKCSTCPEIEFSKNYTGFVKSQDAGLYYFKWKIDNNDELIIHQENSNQPEDILSNGNYKLILFNNIPIKEMSLTDTVKNIKYILSK